jgi:hypothetical protein
MGEDAHVTDKSPRFRDDGSFQPILGVAAASPKTPGAGFKSTVVKKPEMKSPLVRFERAFDCVSDSATIQNAHSPKPAKAVEHVFRMDEHAKSPVTQNTNRRNIASRAR